MLKTQLEIEKENFNMSTIKVRNNLLKDIKSSRIGTTRGAPNILQYYKDALGDELYKATENEDNGKAVTRRVANQLIIALTPEVIAHYTVLEIINSSQKFRTLSSVVGSLAVHFKNEMRLLDARNDSHDSFRFMSITVRKRMHSRARQMSMAQQLITKYQNLPKEKSAKKYHTLALYAIEYLSLVAPRVKRGQFDTLFSIEISNARSKPIKSIHIKPWFLEYIKANIANGNLIPAINTPMVEKPIEWKSFRGGGYHSDFLKYNFISRGRRSDYTGVDMSNTYNAINKMQNTELRVNKRIYEVMKYSVDNNLGYGGMEIKREFNPIQFPFVGKRMNELDEEQLKVVKQWARHRENMRREETINKSKYMKVWRVISEAKRFLEYPRIYFAYYVDYRGRVYPKASALSPQGDKYTKSLLEFANGKQLNSADAVMFLAMQGANTWGNDKVSFKEKYHWVLDNEEMIGECASNPYADDAQWHNADDPWNFLAFCFEWSDFRADPLNFESRLSIAMDGSCNGLQHLSAMFLDEVGGKSVNLVDNKVKGDIYEDVKNLAISIIKNSGDPLGKKLLDNDCVTRKSCKKPVMTVPYSGTKMGTRGFIRDYMEDNNLYKYFTPDEISAALTLYTNSLWEAIESIIVKGREIMRFLSKSAPKIIKASDNGIITWTTPNGFKVVQRKPNIKKVQVTTMLGDFAGKRRSMVQMGYVTDIPNTRKHGSSISPNLIHSLDACHLQNTINSLPDGLSFNMIHDSYGTHASDSKALYEAIRRQFYDIYKNKDVLQKFIAQQPEFEVVNLPTFGNLDLSKVLNSEYFFA